MKAPNKTDLELAAAHKYRLLNGELAISVTGVLKLLDDDGKSAKMAGAAAKLALEGLNYRQEWKAKADLGSRVHGHCEAWLRGEDAEVLPEEHGYIDALEKFFVDRTPQPVEIERVVLNDMGYGGRFDFIAKIGRQLWLIDLKTGRKYALEHTCQLSAYRFADGMAIYDDAGALAAIEPMPPVQHAGCLYLSGDGTYELVEYPADELAFDVFCDLLAINHSIKLLKKDLPK